MGAGPQPEPHSPWMWGLGQGGWLGLGATLRVLVRWRPRPWGGARALHGKRGGAGPELGPRVVETVPQTPAAHSSSHSRSAATQVGPGDHCHHPPARARPAGAEDGQGVALCPLLSHWLFEGGSGPYPSDAPGGPQSEEVGGTAHRPPSSRGGWLRHGCGQRLGLRLKHVIEARTTATWRVWSLHTPPAAQASTAQGTRLQVGRSGLTGASSPTPTLAPLPTLGGSARPQRTHRLGEARLGPSWPQVIWDLPDPTQVLPVWWTPCETPGSSDASTPAG